MYEIPFKFSLCFICFLFISINFSIIIFYNYYLKLYTIIAYYIIYYIYSVTQIEKVFNAASHKKVWDHFTKAQRKNIDQWKKLATVCII